jgi:hypothetical protein
VAHRQNRGPASGPPKATPPLMAQLLLNPIDWGEAATLTRNDD